MSLKFCIIIESKSQNTFFAIVLYTNMAAVTSRENREFNQGTITSSKVIVRLLGGKISNFGTNIAALSFSWCCKLVIFHCYFMFRAISQVVIMS